MPEFKIKGIDDAVEKLKSFNDELIKVDKQLDVIDKRGDTFLKHQLMLALIKKSKLSEVRNPLFLPDFKEFWKAIKE